MSVISRYEKKGGFLQLLVLLETSSEDKKNKFLKMIEEEKANWGFALRKQLLSVERVYNWPDDYVAEIFSGIPAMSVACVVHGLSEENRNKTLKVLANADRVKVLEILQTKVPTSGEVATSQGNIFAKVRELQKNNVLKFNEVDPDFVIEDSIEDLLNKKKSKFDLSGEVPVAATAVAADKATDLRPKAAGGKPEPVMDIPNLKGEAGQEAIFKEIKKIKLQLLELHEENTKLRAENQALRTAISAMTGTVKSA